MESGHGNTRTPTVAIVGRPNVGKSTLFNRLMGRRQAIVLDEPGVTRDRIVGTARLADAVRVDLVDTGGLVPGDDPLGLNRQVELAIEESDVVLFLVDGKAGLTVADERVWDALRRHHKPTILVVNKADVRTAREGFSEFYRVPAERHLLVSSEHGTGVGELVEELLELLPERAPAPVPEGAAAVAIVGRPNVGKSSLVNRLLGAPRTLVSPAAGTTRDPVDSVLEHGDRRYLLIDTAGIRRRSRVSGAPEDLAVMMARRQIERADVSILVLDAAAGVTSGDLAIAGAIWELGRAAIVAPNKWDLLQEEAREGLEASMPRLAQVLAAPRRVNLAATTGRGVDRLFPRLEETLADYRLQLATSEVNRLFQRIVQRHNPPQVRGRPWKLLYATQVGTAPPTFMLFANRTLERRSTYRRYLENALRDELGGLPGIPLRLVVRAR